MPSQRPCAAFDPIPPDLDLAQLVEETSNFEYVPRISCEMIEEQGLESFDKLVLLHVILGGKPLVIEGFNYRLDEWTFTSQWLQDNCGKKFEQARNITKKQNMPLSIGHYLNNMSKLANQWTPQNYKEPDRQRIYLKDIDCPQVWHDKLKECIPPSIFYLNESTGDIGGPASVEALPGSSNTRGQGVARSGDLMSCLPPPMRAENLMCYIGHEGTYTPAHREMCASLGQNLMVETSGDRDAEGKPTKPGSSIWFMTETSDRHTVSEYWLSTLGHDIEVENHFAQVNAWKAAPFKTYIVEQRAGDFILIPPLAPHQVWNRGTRTMKVAWNRTTVETLEMALHEALPRARMVCRDEQYKNKAIVYFALEKYSGLLKEVAAQKQSASPEVRCELDYGLKIRQLQKDFRRLFALYTEILLTEMLAPSSASEKKGQYIPYDSFITCSYCRCNIFNRFLTCPSCIETLENGDENTYDICMDCFAMGRSCWCISKYKWIEQFPWKELVQKHESWRLLIIDFGGGVTEKSPQPLDVEKKKLGRKTLAQVCQEQLKARPYQDPKKPTPTLSAREQREMIALKKFAKGDKGDTGVDEDDEVLVDDDGNVKKPKFKKSRAARLSKGWTMEHVSHYPEQLWKVATCSKCDRNYSYGSLYRMFDLMPRTVMENPEWECPACLKICSCGACRKKQGVRPYEPIGTVLGHDTKKVADPRSVESLINFNLPNTQWIMVAGDDRPHESRRLSRRRDEAERAKAKDPALDDNYVDEEEYSPIESQYTQNGIMYNTEPDIPIDPILRIGQISGPVNGNARRPGAGSDNIESPQRPPRGTLGWDQSYMVTGRELTPPSDGVGSKHGRHDIAGQTRAPLANTRTSDNHASASNGISYEYPDPTQPQTSPSGHYLSPEQSKQRHSEAKPIRSDLSQTPQCASNGQPYLTQLEMMLEDAKKNDRYISLEAAFTGKSLRLKLSIPRARLATVAGVDPRLPSVPDSAQAFRREPPVLLQSDYHNTLSAQLPNTSKKRKARKEQDEEFSIRKRKDRKPSATTPTVTAKDTRRNSAKYLEISSDSEASAQAETSSFIPINKTQEPRLLPKYLAQRHGPNEPSSLEEIPVRNPSIPASQPNGQKDTADSLLPAEAHVESSIVRTIYDTTSPIDVLYAESPPAADPDTPMQEAGATARPMQLVLGKVVPVKVVSVKPTPAKHVPGKPAPVDPALKLAEDNRMAKLKALHWADDDDNDDDFSNSDSSTEQNLVKQTTPKGSSTATPKSISTRPTANGKKVKIVSAKSASVKGKNATEARETGRCSLEA